MNEILIDRVCDHFGLDTSDYSIPYIMSWGEDKKLTPLTNSLDAILKASNEVIDQMETHLWVDMGIDKTIGEASFTESDPISCMKQRREERKSLLTGPQNLASKSIAAQTKPRRDRSMER